MSLREIARTVGVGRRTVSAIADGSRPRLGTPLPTPDLLELLPDDCGRGTCGECVYCRALDYQQRTKQGKPVA